MATPGPISFCPECGGQGGYLRGACVCVTSKRALAAWPHRLVPCAYCCRPIWRDEVCGICDEANCPRCNFRFSPEEPFGKGCPACGLRPHEPMLELWPYEDRPLSQER